MQLFPVTCCCCSCSSGASTNVVSGGGGGSIIVQGTPTAIIDSRTGTQFVAGTIATSYSSGGIWRFNDGPDGLGPRWDQLQA